MSIYWEDWKTPGVKRLSENFGWLIDDRIYDLSAVGCINGTEYQLFAGLDDRGVEKQSIKGIAESFEEGRQIIELYWLENGDRIIQDVQNKVGDKWKKRIVRR